MKPIRTIVLAALAACALVLLLGACSSGSTDYTDTYAGTWTATSVASDGTTITSETLELVGLQVTLTLDEDKTGTLDSAGTSYDLTWSPTSETECAVTIEGQDYTATLGSDGALTLDEDGSVIVFAKNAAS